MNAFHLLLLTIAMLLVGRPICGQTVLVLSSYSTSDCNPINLLPFNLTVPLGTCLNNHDFDAVNCTLLSGCISKLSSQGRGFIPYDALVNCTNAQPMYLSVRPVFSPVTNELHVDLYVISEQCNMIPVPLNFKYGECASAFSISKSCNISGSSVSWL